MMLPKMRSMFVLREAVKPRIDTTGVFKSCIGSFMFEHDGANWGVNVYKNMKSGASGTWGSELHKFNEVHASLQWPENQEGGARQIRANSTLKREKLGGKLTGALQVSFGVGLETGKIIGTAYFDDPEPDVEYDDPLRVPIKSMKVDLPADLMVAFRVALDEALEKDLVKILSHKGRKIDDP